MRFDIYGPVLVFHKPEDLEELFVTKNKFLDKHKNVDVHFKPMLKDSILVMPTNK